MLILILTIHTVSWSV